MKRLILIPFLFLLVLIGKSQTIENVDFKFLDEKIVVYYDLVGCRNDNKYEIEIKFSDDKGNTITPRNLSGDAGVVTCGKNKKVVWDLFQEVEKFEGNYKATVSIVNVLDSRGNNLKSTRLKIVKSEKVGNEINVILNKGMSGNIKPKDCYFVLNNNKISNSLGNSTKKIGVIEKTEIKDESTKGILLLNNKLNYATIETNLSNASLQSFRKFNMYLNAFFFANALEGYSGYGLGFETYLKNNNSIGVEGNFLAVLGYYGKPEFDLNLIYNISPYNFSSKIFSLGFNVHPIPIQNTSENEKTITIESKFRIGVIPCLKFGRTRFKIGIEYGKFTKIYSIGNFEKSSSINFYSSLSFSLHK